MQNDKVKKDTYAVIFLRNDGNHIVLETDTVEKAYEKWATYRDKWSEAIGKKLPLAIVEKDASIITAFDPGIVYEIIVRKQELSTKGNPENPYYKEMVQNGFSGTFGKKTGLDLLDKGYKL